MACLYERKKTTALFDLLREKGVSMAVFCTASHWNTEAILLAAKRFGEKYEIERVPVGVAMTYRYPFCPQAKRITYSQDAKAGFFSMAAHLHALCGAPDSPYDRVTALPHLDHADPSRDWWALTQGSVPLASVMFDAQAYPLSQNIEMTREYVREYGDRRLIEGIMDGLGVEGRKKGQGSEKEAELAADYVRKTGIDFLVADLGTEQQSAKSGRVTYQKERAQSLTAALGEKRLVLHGSSCLTDTQLQNLASDGVIRVNVWTRLVREAGLHAANALSKRLEGTPDFEQIESMQYLRDSTEKAAELMEKLFFQLGYQNLSGVILPCESR